MDRLPRAHTRLVHARAAAARALLAAGVALAAIATFAARAPAASYQGSLVARALRDSALALDPAPAGKTIERIVIANHPVVDPGEPWPRWLNHLHKTTLPGVIRKELLFSVGDAWDRKTVDESERNLRSYLCLSAARIVAARGSSPGSVVALVVTKDLWSLRPDVDAEVVGTRLDHLLISPSENNLNGRARVLELGYERFPASTSLAVTYGDRRVGGRRVSLAAVQSLSWSRASSPEGYESGFTLSRPLYQLDQEWSWSASFDTRLGVFRQYRGGSVAGIHMYSTGTELPLSYRYRSTTPAVEVTRATGRSVKQAVTLGVETDTERYDPPAFASPPDTVSLAEFRRRVLPRSAHAGVLIGGYQLFEPRYAKLVNIDTFELTEDFRLGPSLSAQVLVALPALGFSDEYVNPTITASSVWAFGDDYLLASASAGARHENGAVPGTSWVDRSWTVSMRNISPLFGSFRLHTAARLTRRTDERSQSLDPLGGEGSLRGYPSGYFTGSQLWGANVELRSTPADVRSVRLGFAAFVDAGDAWTPPERARFHGSMGAGLRLGFPEFNGPVTRIDFAVPFERVTGVSPAYVTVRAGQAF